MTPTPQELLRDLHTDLLEIIGERELVLLVRYWAALKRAARGAGPQDIIQQPGGGARVSPMIGFDDPLGVGCGALTEPGARMVNLANLLKAIRTCDWAAGEELELVKRRRQTS